MGHRDDAGADGDGDSGADEVAVADISGRCVERMDLKERRAFGLDGAGDSG